MTDLTSAEVASLLTRDEGQFLEFKSLWDREGVVPRPVRRRRVRDWIAEHTAAFANPDGGTLLLGVEDDGAVTGHAYPAAVVEEFFAVPQRRLRPAVDTHAQRVVLGGEELLVLQIEPSEQAVMWEGDGFPYRVGDRVLQEPQEVINDRKQAYRRVGYEPRIRPDATLDDLDLDLVASALDRLLIGERSVEDLLVRSGLIHARRGGYAMTNAALLLFCKPPVVRWHPRAGIRFFRVDGVERHHGTERNVTQLRRLELPIVRLLSEAVGYLSGQIARSERLHDLFFREMPEYPEFAWQEALVNAVAHRDYNDQGREIEVWLYRDRLEVLSPGGLVPPVTLAALRSRRPIHASRNPLIVRTLAEAAIMREEGEGIPRMFEEMEASLLKLPQLTLRESSAFQVTLLNQPVFEGASDEWQHLVKRLRLNAAQRRMLVAQPDGFTNEDFRRLNAVDRDRAYREIHELVQRGVVTPPPAPGRGAVYHVASDLRTARAWLEARVPKIRRFLAKNPHLKNADYRSLFGVTRTTALKELLRLVESGFLVMEGERRGARYRPGPALEVGSGDREL